VTYVVYLLSVVHFLSRHLLKKSFVAEKITPM
jgi:hypothetical protein